MFQEIYFLWIVPYLQFGEMKSPTTTVYMYMEATYASNILKAIFSSHLLVWHLLAFHFFQHLEYLSDGHNI